MMEDKEFYTYVDKLKLEFAISIASLEGCLAVAKICVDTLKEDALPYLEENPSKLPTITNKVAKMLADQLLTEVEKKGKSAYRETLKQYPIEKKPDLEDLR